MKSKTKSPSGQQARIAAPELPVVAVELPKPPGDRDLEQLEEVLGALPGAFSAYENELSEVGRCKRRMNDLMPPPRRRRKSDPDPEVRRLELPDPPEPGKAYVLEENAAIELGRACLRREADRLRSREQRHKAYAVIDELCACDKPYRAAKSRVVEVIDQAAGLAQRTRGRRDTATVALLLRDLERLRSFTFPTDRPHFDFCLECPSNSDDVVADLRKRRKELLTDRVAAFHDLGRPDAHLADADLAEWVPVLLTILDRAHHAMSIVKILSDRSRRHALLRVRSFDRGTLAKHAETLRKRGFARKTENGWVITQAGRRWCRARTVGAHSP